MDMLVLDGTGPFFRTRAHCGGHGHKPRVRYKRCMAAVSVHDCMIEYCCYSRATTRDVFAEATVPQRVGGPSVRLGWLQIKPPSLSAPKRVYSRLVLFHPPAECSYKLLPITCQLAYVTISLAQETLWKRDGSPAHSGSSRLQLKSCDDVGTIHTVLVF